MGVDGLCEENLQGRSPAVVWPDLRQSAAEDTLDDEV